MNKIDLIQKLKQLEGLTTEERSALIELVNTKKKYGLVWEDKPENVEELLRQNLPVLREVKDKYVQAEPMPATEDLFTENEIDHTEQIAPNHILIEGDNLHALTALSFTHKGKIDVIYIDPPYNTGNKDFKYNDSFVDKEDSYRHSKWLSFMNKRLRIAKDLMSEKGVIFMSIDDNENAQLKLLCDDIFSEGNFLNLISIKAKPTAGASGGGEDKRLKKNVEYLLCFIKNRDFFLRFNDVFESTDLQEFIDDYRDEGKSWKYTRVLHSLGDKSYFKDTVDGSGNQIRIYQHKNILIKTISELMLEENISEEDVYFKYFDKVFRDTNAQSSIRQRIMDSTDNLDTFYSIEYKPRSGRNKGSLTTLYYKGRNKDLLAWLSDVAVKEKSRIVKKDKLGTLWANFNWNNVSKEGDIIFPNGKKPVALIKTIIELCSTESKNETILDFFAGSGTALHATMAANAEDGGNRQCILVTNNENNICEEITYERNRRVIQGYTNAKGAAVAGFTNNNLRYYKSEFVPSTRNEANRRLLTNASTELLCIRENCFTNVTKTTSFKNKECNIFKNDVGKYMLVIYHSRNFPTVCEQVIQWTTENFTLPLAEKIRLYCFSPEKDSLVEDFADVADYVEAVPLPDAIYNAFRATFKTLKLDRKHIELNPTEAEIPTTLFDDETTDA